jgi:hypothetical protein
LLKIERYLGAYEFNEFDPAIPKLNHFFLMKLASEKLPVLASDSAHAGARWWPLPLGAMEFAYSYQRDLLVQVERCP